MSVSNLTDLADIAPIDVWDNVRVRRVEGERITLAIVELAPGAVVPEHRHEAEQNGIVISGSIRFRIADEERELGPGGTWRILGLVPHAATAGPEGATVIDTFSPIRTDWNDRPVGEPTTPKWPRPG